MVLTVDVDKFVIRHQYDATDNVRNLLRIRGTILPRTFRCTELWIAIAIHYLLFFIRAFVPCSSDNPTCISDLYKRHVLNLSDTASLTSLVVFFLVFYNGNCYQRFISLYLLVNTAGGQLHSVSLYLRDYFEDPLSRWQVRESFY
jgi:hypothetical protein